MASTVSSSFSLSVDTLKYLFSSSTKSDKAFLNPSPVILCSFPSIFLLFDVCSFQYLVYVFDSMAVMIYRSLHLYIICGNSLHGGMRTMRLTV